MDDTQSLSQTKRECKYHLVWIPKYRKKELYGGLRKYLGSCFKDLVSLKGKSALQIACVYLGKRKNVTGRNFWARGYFVSTVGLDEQMVQVYIKAQGKEDRRLDQLNLFQE